MDFPTVIFWKKKSVKTSNRASQNCVRQNRFTGYSALQLDDHTEIDSFLSSLTMDNLFD